jgi:hypothetical protein
MRGEVSRAGGESIGGDEINLADSRGMVATALKRTCRLAGDSGEKGFQRASAVGVAAICKSQKEH